MNRTWLLLQAQIFNFIPINELRGPNKKKKNASVLLVFGITALVLFLCGYNILTAKTLAEAGEYELIPAYMVSISSFAILFLTLFRSNGILFGSKDMQLLTSLPVKNSEIISSKFLFMYGMNLLIAIIFIIPGSIIWITYANVDVFHSILYLLSTFFVPLIPMCIASLIGVLIVYLSSHFKYRSMFAVVLSFLALGLVAFIASFAMQSSNKDISNIGAMLAGQVTGLYPLSKFFLQGANLSGLLSVSLFLVVSIAVLFLFIKIVAVKYNYFNMLASQTSKYRKQTGRLSAHSLFISLYQKELGRLFSSYMAVLNTGLGVVLLSLFSVFLFIMSPEKLGEYAGVSNMNNFLAEYAPLIVASMLTLSCTSASSLSLEGKNIWILQSSPLSVKTILNSKIAVTCTLHLFGYLLAVFAMLTHLQMNIGQVISLIVIPLCYSSFIAVLGITLNKKYPNYDWSSEVMVVKQSIPVMASSIINIAFVFLPILLCLVFKLSLLPMLWIVAGVLITAATIMYHKVCVSNYI